MKALFGHCRKVKVRRSVHEFKCFQIDCNTKSLNVFKLAAVQTVRSYNSILVETTKLVLGKNVHLTLIYNIYGYCMLSGCS